MKNVFLTVLFTFMLNLLALAGNGDAVVGTWKTADGKAHIQVFKANGKYYGKIVWLKEPNDENGKPKKDDNNPDESKRDTPILNSKILKDFEYDADDEEWEDGTIYDPKSGSTYKCTMELEDKNTLEVRGYVGFEWLGKTEVWTRIQ